MKEFIIEENEAGGEKSANKSESAGEWAENVRLWTKNFQIIPDTYGLW